jgi:threonylcarbamoyladenosine tRNA methylthiotransferase MtaB
MSESEFVTFGCRLNTFESEVMRGHAAKAGMKTRLSSIPCGDGGGTAGAAGHSQAHKDKPDAK